MRMIVGTYVNNVMLLQVEEYHKCVSSCILGLEHF